MSEARANRQRKRIGIAERVTLTADPPGSYTWSVSGGGTLSSNSGTSVVFTAGDRASTSTITAQGSHSCTITFTVVEPDGVYQVKFGNTLHDDGKASAGFRGISYLEPRDVSFENIEINEGKARGIGTGSRSSETGKPHTPWPKWASVGGGSDETGSVVQGPLQTSSETGTTYWDWVSGEVDWWSPGPWANGTFRWDIPWEFRVSGGTKKPFTKLIHRSELDGLSGRMTVSKGGVRVTAMPADAEERP